MDVTNTRYVTRDKRITDNYVNENTVVVWGGAKPTCYDKAKTMICWSGTGNYKRYTVKEFKKKYGWTPRKGSCEKFKLVELLVISK